MGTPDKVKAGKPVLLVEIGNEWLKVLQAEPSRGGVAVTRAHMERFESIGPDVSKSLAAVIKTQKFIRSPVVACLPRQLVNVRVIELPSVKPEEVADMLELQVGKQTPYSREEIVFDYRYAGGQRAGYSRLMLVIAQRAVVRERYFILEEAGLDVDRMTVGSEGLLTWYGVQAGTGRRDAEVLLDVDAGFSDFTVVHQGQIVFTRSLLIGANHLMEAGGTWGEKLAHEIHQSLEMYRAENAAMEPSRLILTGAGSRLSALPAEIGERTGMAVEAVDSSARVSRWPERPSLAESEFAAVSLTALTGMALAPDRLEMHLVPDSVKLRTDLVTKARILTRLGMLLMTLMMCLSFWLLAKAYLVRAQRDLVERKAKALEPIVQRVTDMMRLARVVQQRQDPDLSAIALVAGLHPLVPGTGIRLDSVELDIEGGRLTLGGNAASRQDVRDMTTALEKSPQYRDVKEISSRRGDDGRFQFQVTAELERRR